MSTYREQTVKAKAVRAGIVDQRRAAGRNARPRPVVLEHRKSPNYKGALLEFVKDWTKWGAYRNQAEAEAAMSNAARKYPFYEFRIKPEAVNV